MSVKYDQRANDDEKLYMMGKQITARKLTKLWVHNNAIIKQYSSPFHLIWALRQNT